MRGIAIAIAVLIGLIAPARAQKAEIDAVNAKWMDFFNKGDFASLAQLYTEDAVALPPGVSIVKGRTAIAAMWKSMAEQVSAPKLDGPRRQDDRPFRAREIGTFSLKTKAPEPQDLNGKYVVVWEKIGADWKLATDIWNDHK